MQHQIQCAPGLVVSVPVLVEAECLEKRDPELSLQLADEAAALTRVLGKTPSGQPRRELLSLDDFLGRVLGLTPELFARGDELPADLELYVPEGGETLRPTLALKKRGEPAAAATAADGVPDVSTPQSRAGESFVMLVSELPGVPLDAVDRREGHWSYPPLAKFDRLLRACRVPIGLLTNREELRLVYAPHGESSGVLTFRVGDLAAVGGREILDVQEKEPRGRRVRATGLTPLVRAQSRNAASYPIAAWPDRSGPDGIKPGRARSGSRISLASGRR